MLKDKIRINYLKKNNPVTFVVFDILYEDKNLLELSLIKRKKILNLIRLPPPTVSMFPKDGIVEKLPKLI